MFEEVYRPGSQALKTSPCSKEIPWSRDVNITLPRSPHFPASFFILSHSFVLLFVSQSFCINARARAKIFPPDFLVEWQNHIFILRRSETSCISLSIEQSADTCVLVSYVLNLFPSYRLPALAPPSSRNTSRHWPSQSSYTTSPAFALKVDRPRRPRDSRWRRESPRFRDNLDIESHSRDPFRKKGCSSEANLLCNTSSSLFFYVVHFCHARMFTRNGQFFFAKLQPTREITKFSTKLWVFFSFLIPAMFFLQIQ